MSAQRTMVSVLGAAVLALGAAGCRESPLDKPLVAYPSRAPESAPTRPIGPGAPSIEAAARGKPRAEPTYAPSAEPTYAPSAESTYAPSAEPAAAARPPAETTSAEIVDGRAPPAPAEAPSEPRPVRRASREERAWGYGVVGGVAEDQARAASEAPAVACPPGPAVVITSEPAGSRLAETTTARPAPATSDTPQVTSTAFGGVAAGVTYDDGLFDRPPGASRAQQGAGVAPLVPVDPGAFEDVLVPEPAARPAGEMSDQSPSSRR